MDHEKLFLKLVLDSWETQNARIDKLLTTLSDTELMAETAPGRNTGFYLLGHLAAVNDNLFPLLGLGEKLHPELANIFLTHPDKSRLEVPSLAALKEYWKTINTGLSKHFSKMSSEEWFAKHNSVSAEDFVKEPHRNKINILINRANHQSYHAGQLAYLVKKTGL